MAAAERKLLSSFIACPWPGCGPTWNRRLEKAASTGRCPSTAAAGPAATDVADAACQRPGPAAAHRRSEIDTRPARPARSAQATAAAMPIARQVDDRPQAMLAGAHDLADHRERGGAVREPRAPAVAASAATPAPCATPSAPCPARSVADHLEAVAGEGAGHLYFHVAQADEAEGPRRRVRRHRCPPRSAPRGPGGTPRHRSGHRNRLVSCIRPRAARRGCSRCPGTKEVQLELLPRLGPEDCRGCSGWRRRSVRCGWLQISPQHQVVNSRWNWALKPSAPAMARST